MTNKAIYDEHYMRLYYFDYRYCKDSAITSDFVVAAFRALFSGEIPDEEDLIKLFLYGHVASACTNYCTRTLGIPPPDKLDFINTRLDAEVIYSKYIRLHGRAV